eukprot:1720706-Alexandrium_andersonii.AAC.1
MCIRDRVSLGWKGSGGRAGGPLGSAFLPGKLFLLRASPPSTWASAQGGRLRSSSPQSRPASSRSQSFGRRPMSAASTSRV